MNDLEVKFNGVFKDVKTKNGANGREKSVVFSTHNLRVLRELDERLGENVTVIVQFDEAQAPPVKPPTAPEPELPGIPNCVTVVYQCENCDKLTFSRDFANMETAQAAQIERCPKCGSADAVVVFKYHEGVKDDPDAVQEPGAVAEPPLANDAAGEIDLNAGAAAGGDAAVDAVAENEAPPFTGPAQEPPPPGGPPE